MDFTSNIARYIMRKTRKNLDLKQEDIGIVSYGTISNIERGVSVSEQIIRSYLEKLGLTEQRLSELVSQEEKRIDDLNFKLESIEFMLKNGKRKKAEELLKRIEFESFHPLAPYYNYLEGRCYQLKKDWKKAEKQFEFAIRLHNQYKLDVKDNIVPMCYNELSICSYNQNQLDKALAYVEMGLNSFDENKERKDIKFTLLSNKILYLLQSLQFDLAKQTLDEAWEQIIEVNVLEILLILFKYRAIILRKMRKYSEAIQICKEGIEIARRNRGQNRYLDLINVLGSVYLLQKDFKKAKMCFQMVLDDDFECEYPRRHLDAMTYLAILHSSNKDWNEAEIAIKRAVEIGRNISDVYRLSKTLIVYGNILLDQNRFEEAIPIYQEAEELSRKNGFKVREHTVLLQLTHCFDSIGDKQRWNSSVKKLLALQKELILFGEDEVYGISDED